MERARYQPAARSIKTEMAVLAGPTRSFSGWAFVKMGKISRAAKRYVMVRSSQLIISTTESVRDAILDVPISGGTMTIDKYNRSECCVRLGPYRMWMQWPSEAELRVCKQAFEYANRDVTNYYKLVNHRQLGKGRSSEVVFAFDVSSGDHVAVKIMNKDKAYDREFAEREVAIRMSIQHSCILQTIDIFESSFDLFIIMELMGGGSLDRRMARQSAPLSEAEVRVIMWRLFTALSHLHSHGIAHRNVKPQNIFIDISDDLRWCETAKLSDFSLACFLDDPDCMRQVVGTPEYLAPEASVMTRAAHGGRQVVFGTEVDMWAAGVTMYNLLSMELPFEGDYPPDVFKKARSAKLSFSAKGFRHMSPEARSLIKSLLNVDRRKRPTAETVIFHPWFQTEPKEDDLTDYTAALSLTSEFGIVTDSLFRFRVAVLAVRMIHRLVKRTPGLRLIPRVEKKFQFNVSGIDIAPVLSSYEDIAEKSECSIFQRNSTTVMSRISTGSTVKSGSSTGDSITSPMTASIPMSSSGDGSDRKEDFITRTNSRPIRQSSFGSSSIGSVHRLFSETIGQFGMSVGNGSHREAEDEHSRSTWRRRKRGAKEGYAPTSSFY